jgi:hypothetical protein
LATQEKVTRSPEGRVKALHFKKQNQMDSRLRGNDGKYNELDSGLRRNDEQKRRSKQTIPTQPSP